MGGWWWLVAGAQRPSGQPKADAYNMRFSVTLHRKSVGFGRVVSQTIAQQAERVNQYYCASPCLFVCIFDSIPLVSDLQSFSKDSSFASLLLTTNGRWPP
jgi:hypothetical protein